MSNRLIKNGSDVILTDDRIIATIRILESGKIQVDAKGMPAPILIKHLNNIITDIQFACFSMASDLPRVQPELVVPNL